MGRRSNHNRSIVRVRVALTQGVEVEDEVGAFDQEDHQGHEDGGGQ